MQSRPRRLLIEPWPYHSHLQYAGFGAVFLSVAVLLVVMLFRFNYDAIYLTYVSDRLVATQGRVQVAEWTKSGRGSVANK